MTGSAAPPAPIQMQIRAGTAGTGKQCSTLTYIIDLIFETNQLSFTFFDVSSSPSELSFPVRTCLPHLPLHVVLPTSHLNWLFNGVQGSTLSPWRMTHTTHNLSDLLLDLTTSGASFFSVFWAWSRFLSPPPPQEPIYSSLYPSLMRVRSKHELVIRQGIVCGPVLCPPGRLWRGGRSGGRLRRVTPSPFPGAHTPGGPALCPETSASSFFPARWAAVSAPRVGSSVSTCSVTAHPRTHDISTSAPSCLADF